MTQKFEKNSKTMEKSEKWKKHDVFSRCVCVVFNLSRPLKNQNRTGSIFQQELQPNGVYSLPLGLLGMQSRNLAAAAAAAATQV